MGSDPMRDSFLVLRDSGRDWFPILFFSAREPLALQLKLIVTENNTKVRQKKLYRRPLSVRVSCV